MTMKNCCDTYGLFCRGILICTGIAGLVLSCLAAVGCDFITFDTLTKGSGAFGVFLFTDPSTGECVEFPEDLPFNNPQQTARAGAALAPIFGLISLVLFLFEFCFCRICCGRCIELSTLLVAMICQGLTFFAFDTDNLCQLDGSSCGIGTDGIYSIVAFCMYVLAGFVMCCTPKPTPLLCRVKEEEEDKKETKEEADKQELEHDEEAQKAAAAASAGDDGMVAAKTE